MTDQVNYKIPVVRGLDLEITAVGVGKTEKDLDGISARFKNIRPAFEVVLELIERSEKRLFKRLAGKYVDTGDLMASLTQADANEAIRVAHAEELEFGTGLYYARYQRDQYRKSAVLKLLPKEKREANATILGYITHGLGGSLT